MTRHFLRDDDLSPAEQAEVLALAKKLKADRHAARPFEGPRAVGIIFDKPTLRTQASFTAGVAELGGYPMLVDGNLAQIGARESIADTARVLGRMVSAVVWRTFGQERIEEMAAYAGVPVVNALTDDFHPCQLLADLQTIEEHKGTLAGLTVAFLGDAASNMAHSFLLACATAGMHVRVSGPEGFTPDDAILARAREIAGTTGGSAAYVRGPRRRRSPAPTSWSPTPGCRWARRARRPSAASRSCPTPSTRPCSGTPKDDAIVMHCLPAYRGKEIAAEVIDGPQSVVWDEAENRLHAQKALLTWLMEHQT